MKGRQIMWLFLLEGSFIGLVGAVIGCAVGYGLVHRSRPGRASTLALPLGMGEVTALMGSRIYPSVTPANVLFAGLAVTVIAALASLYPAWQASRKEPAAALHHI